MFIFVPFSLLCKSFSILAVLWKCINILNSFDLVCHPILINCNHLVRVNRYKYKTKYYKKHVYAFLKVSWAQRKHQLTALLYF